MPALKQSTFHGYLGSCALLKESPTPICEPLTDFVENTLREAKEVPPKKWVRGKFLRMCILQIWICTICSSSITQRKEILKKFTRHDVMSKAFTWPPKLEHHLSCSVPAHVTSLAQCSAFFFFLVKWCVICYRRLDPAAIFHAWPTSAKSFMKVYRCTKLMSKQTAERKSGAWGESHTIFWPLK